MNRMNRTATLGLAGLAIGGAMVLGAIRRGQAEQPQPKEDPAAAAKPKPAKPAVDPRADERLKKMSDFMAKQQRFAVHTNGELEVVLEDGQKLEFPFESDVKVQRPNRLRADRRGAKVDLRFLYDGQQFVLYGADANMYAKAPAPPSLDAAIEDAREKLGVDAPGADLLFTDSYAGLRPEVVSGMFLGPETIKGVECDHLAFRGKEVDFQIWIRTGDTPTPCRYVVTSVGIKGNPDYSADFVNWDLAPRFDAAAFTFQPPPGAEQVSFLTSDEMKKHATEKMKRDTQQPPGDAP